MEKTRDHRLDNLRALLMLLVVFCHLTVDIATGELSTVLYLAIYVFHMPAFVMVTGYFARFRPIKMLAGIALPYVVFQLAASIRRNVVAGRLWSTGLTLLDPQWTLWYLLACLPWYCTIPALERVRTPAGRARVVGFSFVASCACGFVPWIGGFLDLSRVVVLFPFFSAGYYAGRMGLSRRMDELERKKLARLRVWCLAAVCLSMVLLYAHGTPPSYVLFRDAPFGSWWDFETRSLAQIAAVAWCALLFVVSPSRDLGFVTQVGRNTMCVYLLHPWLMRALRHALPLPGGEVAHVLECLALAVGMLALLGNDRVGGAFRYVFGGGWLARRKRGA